MITPKQHDDLEELVKPLIKWLNDNCHPHTQLIIEPDGAQLVEAMARVVNLEYIKD
jgi:hypothetical protein